MNAVTLTPLDIAVAASLVVVDAAISMALGLRLHGRLAWASARMVVQLAAVGVLLRWVLRLHDPWVTLLVVVAMALIAAREIAARPERRLKGLGGLAISAPSVALATVATAGLALTTAIRPQPWWDARYAIPLVGIVLGSVLNAGSLALDTLLEGAADGRAGIEAQLALGASFAQATRPLLRRAVRRGLLPVVNQMSAAGLITLPGIMTGQIMAGMDPLEAVKYQILLMFLLAGASGLAALSIAILALRRLTDERQRLRLDRLA
ncbi:MAG: iron export ABC transporter permease subunit FetB [Caulobacteraceae bacterium]|nr:iron export ABC transporter permease subunit FetB [Caulobacter sp.]